MSGRRIIDGLREAVAWTRGLRSIPADWADSYDWDHARAEAALPNGLCIVPQGIDHNEFFDELQRRLTRPTS